MDEISIPDGVAFADLKLEREPFTKQLMYDPAPLARLVVAVKPQPTERTGWCCFVRPLMAAPDCDFLFARSSPHRRPRH